MATFKYLKKELGHFLHCGSKGQAGSKQPLQRNLEWHHKNVLGQSVGSMRRQGKRTLGVKGAQGHALSRPTTARPQIHNRCVLRILLACPLL